MISFLRKVSSVPRVILRCQQLVPTPRAYQKLGLVPIGFQRRFISMQEAKIGIKDDAEKKTKSKSKPKKTAKKVKKPIDIPVIDVPASPKQAFIKKNRPMLVKQKFTTKKAFNDFVKNTIKSLTTEELQVYKNLVKKSKSKQLKSQLPPRHSVFALYVKDMYAKVKNQNPGFTTKSILKQIASDWQDESEFVKEEYKERVVSLNKEYREKFSHLKEERSKSNSTSYTVFVKENVSEIQHDNPTLTQTELFAKMGEEWNKLGDDEKFHYKQKAMSI